MAQILDEGKYWKLVINPDAQFVQNIDEPNKGYKARLGYSSEQDKHVVMEVFYDKSRYPIDVVVKKVEELRSCKRCNTLDKEKLSLEKVQVGDDNASSKAALQSVKPADTPAPASDYAVRQRPGVKDIFANAFFDVYLTKPGRYFLGMLLNDDSLIDSVSPKTPEENSEFMNEMIGFFSGDTDFFRTPEQAKEYLEVLRASHDEESPGLPGAKNLRLKKKRATPVINTIIY